MNGFELNDVKIKLNHGQFPTIEFIMPLVDDHEGNPEKISCLLQTNCLRVVQQIQDIYNIRIGSIELPSNGEKKLKKLLIIVYVGNKNELVLKYSHGRQPKSNIVYLQRT